MLKAIHKETKKLVSAWQLIKDSSWSGKEKDKFIAPNHEIGNWIELEKKGISEVEVTFIKDHLRDGNFVCDYFRIITDGATYSSINESEEHKLAKDTIYQWAWDDKIIIKGYGKLSTFGISNISLEKGLGNMRADVLIDFKERHPLLGRGIAFEIQLSPQNSEKTRNRTNDRCFQDYSVIWIWHNEIKKDKYEFMVETVYDSIKRAERDIRRETNFFLGDLSQKTEVKILELKKDFEAFVSSIDKTNQKYIISEKEAAINFTEKYYLNLKNEIKERLDRLKIDIENKISSLNIESIIKNKIDSFNINEIIRGLIIDKNRICPRCGGKLHEYKNGDLLCNDCPYHKLEEEHNESKDKAH